MKFLWSVMASMLLLIPAIGGAATVLGPYSETTDNNMFIGYAPGVGRIEPNSIDTNVSLTFDFLAAEDLWFTGAGTIGGVSQFANLSVSTTSTAGVGFTPVPGEDWATFLFAPTSVTSGITETLTFSWDSVATLAPATILFEVVAGGEGVVTPEPPAVPLPAAVWLFGSGLLGLVGMARRKKAA